MTPREYRSALAAAWPELETDFDAITESYQRTRYGGLGIGPWELETALAGWLRIAKKGEMTGR